MGMNSLLLVSILCAVQVVQSQAQAFIVKRKCDGDGNSLSLHCPSGQIQVEYANFGRTTSNSQVCPYGASHLNVDTCTRDQDIYTNKAQNLCNGRQSCTVMRLALGDACVGTYKYLEVRYRCTRTIAPLVERLCDGQGTSLHLQCPSGLIQIEYANFGRTTSSAQVCPYHTTHLNEITCTKDEEAYTKHARIWCDGKQSCTVERLNLGDACFGTYKYLEVQYNCRRKVAALVERNCDGHGNSVSLDCPSGWIQVEYANAGRTTSSSQVCPYHTTHRNINTCTRDEGIYIDYVKSLCNGKRSCTVVRLNLGDACAGTYKYLEVKYNCAGILAIPEN